MDIKVLFRNVSQWNGTMLNYAVLVVGEKMSVLVHYPLITSGENKQLVKNVKNKNTDRFIKPQGMFLTTAKEAGEVDRYHNLSYYTNAKFDEIGGNPEDYGLYFPKAYTNPQFSVKITVNPLIDDKLLESIKHSNYTFPIIVTGEEYTRLDTQVLNNYFTYYCTGCSQEFVVEDRKQHHEVVCPHCKKKNPNSSPRFLVLKAFRDYKEETFSGSSMDIYGGGEFGTGAKKSFYYFMKHPENPNGIKIYKIVHTVDTTKDTISISYNVEYVIEHIVGKKMVAYKSRRGTLVEADPLVALNINSRNIGRNDDIIFENAEDFYEFATNNEKFLKMSGFLSALKFSPQILNLQAFFVVYIGIVNKYPILEQIIKMGHARLFFNLYNAMMKSASKEEILQRSDEINEIVNSESHGGKDVLRFPIYIGEYLIQKDATLEEYYYWRDLYELTHMTKEQFYNLTESFNYAIIHGQSGLKTIGNILKFGYSIEKLMNYIVKVSRKKNLNTTTVIDMLDDYLNMCDILQVQPDLYPQDLKKQHDDISNIFKARKKIEYDARLNQIGNECEKYVIPDEEELDKIGIPKLFNEYTVVFPKSEIDFINEGNQQHNCVGSYPNKVRNGSSVVFFIRKKSSPENSFITAECVRNGLGQCYYSNNRIVEKNELIAFARYIANKIKAGVRSKKIHALNNID